MKIKRNFSLYILFCMQAFLFGSRLRKTGLSRQKARRKLSSSSGFISRGW